MSTNIRNPLVSASVNQLSLGAHKRQRSPEKLSGSKRARNGTLSKLRDSQREEARQAKRAQREAEQEHFRIKYREEFPKWSFFFNTTAEIRATFVPRIQELGARCETFFSSKVTHVITTHRFTTFSTSNKENSSKQSQGTLRSPINLTTKADEDLLEKAKQFRMKVWDADKLESVLNRTQNITLSPKAVRSPKLNEILEAERKSGITMERDPYARRNDFEYFSRNCCFVLIEDMYGQYSTIAAQDYPIELKNGVMAGDWPTLYLDPRCHSPFIPFDNKENKRRTQTLEAERLRKQDRKLRERRRREKQIERTKESQQWGLRRTVSTSNIKAEMVDTIDEETVNPGEGHPVDIASGFVGTGYIAASGNSVSIISGTGTTSATGLMQRSATSLALRKQIVNQVVVKRNLGEAQPALRKSKSTSTMCLPKREETLKPGFCESCRTKFEDFQKHIKGKRHRKFATNNENFLELDCLLARIERRPLKVTDGQICPPQIAS